MFVYRPNFIPRSIVLIGCGGTGSRLLPPLVQLVRSCQQKNNPSGFLHAPIPLVLVDGDTVEEKNLLRQNFHPKDVGQHKATVLANRYANAWGEPIYTVPQFINDEDIFNKIAETKGTNRRIQEDYSNTIFVLAVDSVVARRTLLRNIFSGAGSGKCFIIDPGNEDDFGQVRCFTNSLVKPSVADLEREDLFSSIPDRDILEVITSNIPMPVISYLEMGTSKQEVSCAGLPQTLAINTMMATITLGMIQNFLFFKTFKYDCVRFSLVNGTSVDTNSVHRWMERGSATLVGGGERYKSGRGPDAEIKGDDLTDEQRLFRGFFLGRGLHSDFSARHYSGPDGRNISPPLKNSEPLNGYALFLAYARLVAETYKTRGMKVENGKVVPIAPVIPKKIPALVPILPEGGEGAAVPREKAPRRRAPLPPIPAEVIPPSMRAPSSSLYREDSPVWETSDPQDPEELF